MMRESCSEKRKKQKTKTKTMNIGSLLCFVFFIGVVVVASRFPAVEASPPPPWAWILSAVADDEGKE